MALTKSEKIAIICAIAPTLLTVLIDWIKDEPVLTTLFSWLRVAFKWLWQVSSNEIPVWSVLLFFAAVGMTLVVWIRKLANQPLAFNFFDYKEDTFEGYRWTWNYEFKPPQTKPYIAELRAYCPECDSILRNRARIFDSTLTECVRCEYKLNGDIYAKVYLQKIELLIIDNIERKNKLNVAVGTKLP